VRGSFIGIFAPAESKLKENQNFAQDSTSRLQDTYIIISTSLKINGIFGAAVIQRMFQRGSCGAAVIQLSFWSDSYSTHWLSVYIW